MPICRNRPTEAGALLDRVGPPRVKAGQAISLFGRSLRDCVARVVDILLACGLGLVTLPVVLLAGLAIVIENPGPVFCYERRRFPNAGGVFLLKLRTTMHHPEQRGRLVWEQETRVGSVLRVARIDELPRLVHVIRGEMSFFGAAGLPPLFED